MTDTKKIKFFIKELEEKFEGNISMIALTGERALKNGFFVHLNIVLKSFKGGELVTLTKILSSYPEIPQIELFSSEEELKVISFDKLVPLYTDCRVLYGSKQNIPKIAKSDIRKCAINMLTQVLFELRELALYTDLEEGAGQLLWLYYKAAQSIQLCFYLEGDKFVADLLVLKEMVGDREYVVIDMVENWQKLKNDRKDNPEGHIQFLENFCYLQLTKLLFKK